MASSVRLENKDYALAEALTELQNLAEASGQQEQGGETSGERIYLAARRELEAK